MQRLSWLRTGRRGGRLWRGRDGERGATAVVVALLLVPMLGFGAIAVDIGQMYAEQARLQVPPDAAALAVAKDCAQGSCGNAQATAQAMVTVNAAGAAAGPPAVTAVPPSVTVTGSTPSEHGSCGRRWRRRCRVRRWRGRRCSSIGTNCLAGGRRGGMADDLPRPATLALKAACGIERARESRAVLMRAVLGSARRDRSPPRG